MLRAAAPRAAATTARRLPVRMMASPDAETARWTRAWTVEDIDADNRPRFDAARPSPALADLLQRQPDLVAGRRVLVPGCGRGYDLPPLVRAGAVAATGWDYVPAASAAANAHLDTLLSSGAVTAAERAAVRVECADFFASTRPPFRFGAAYDYTFMCALPPSMRPAWAARYASLIEIGGVLITLIFPVQPPERASEPGPPWPVTPAEYQALLTAGGAFACEALARVPEPLSHKGRAGREWLGVWRRQGSGGGGKL